ncbi:hypothetical protein HY745_02255 [Candidatus Desantisbacteria bacterium]|nr:hypothetical protein [Candidatus Desantisbacteria bacterium]
MTTPLKNDLDGLERLLKLQDKIFKHVKKYEDAGSFKSLYEVNKDINNCLSDLRKEVFNNYAKRRPLTKQRLKNIIRILEALKNILDVFFNSKICQVVSEIIKAITNKTGKQNDKN